MRAFAVLLCFYIVQSCSADDQPTANLGGIPWIVSLQTNLNRGFCVGSLISDSWILTASHCVVDADSIYIRFGATQLGSPRLTRTANTFRLHPNFNATTGENDIALIHIGSKIQFTDYIHPVALPCAGATVPHCASFCGYGVGNDPSTPGQHLNCYNVTVEDSGNGDLWAYSAVGFATRFDIGAPLVQNRVIYGSLIGYARGGNEIIGRFLNLPNYAAWIEAEIAISL